MLWADNVTEQLSSSHTDEDTILIMASKFQERMQLDQGFQIPFREAALADESSTASKIINTRQGVFVGSHDQWLLAQPSRRDQEAVIQ